MHLCPCAAHKCNKFDGVAYKPPDTVEPVSRDVFGGGPGWEGWPKDRSAPRVRDLGDVLEIRCSRRRQADGWFGAAICGVAVATLMWSVFTYNDFDVLKVAAAVAVCLPFAGFGLGMLLPCLRPWIRADQAMVTVGIWRPERVPWGEITGVRATPPRWTRSVRLGLTGRSATIWCRPGTLFSRWPRQVETQMQDVARLLVAFGRRQGVLQTAGSPR